MVTHDDKACSIWLASKGSLAVDQQEYVAWLRASPSTSGRKTFIAVEGFGNVFEEEIPAGKSTNDVSPNSGEIPLLRLIR